MVEDKPYKDSRVYHIGENFTVSSHECARISLQNERQIITSRTFHHEEGNTMPGKPLAGLYSAPGNTAPTHLLGNTKGYHH